MKYRHQHPNWKGDKASYKAIHLDARKNWLKESCEDCGATGRKLHMANISGKYLRKLSDWKTLCVPCHHKFDKESHRNVQKPGSSGYVGVWPRKSGRWRSIISIERYKVNLGHFKDIETAVMIRLAAEQQLITKEK